MTRIWEGGQVFSHFPGFRTVRLVNLLLQAECGHYDFVESEIKSIRRAASIGNDSLERLVFQFVRLYPLPHTRHERNRLWSRFRPRVETIVRAEYERPLLKYFDFAAWIESRLTGVGLAEVITRNAGRQAGPGH